MIIIADDFGLTDGVNKGILECYKSNSITRASLMVNQKYTKDAIKLIIDNSLKFGLHFNLSEGYAISDNRILSKDSFYDTDIAWIEEELKAQLKVIYDSDLDICHIDMHHNLNFERKDVHDLLLKYNTNIRGADYTNLFSKNPSEILLFKLLLDKNIGEIGVHPGYSDDLLNSISTYNTSRELELNILLNNVDTINIFTDREER